MRARARPYATPVYVSTGLPVLTVEGLLQWAYGHEKVHLAREPGMDGAMRARPAGFAAQSSSERIGAAVGTSLNLGFEAPADAYAVARAVEASGAAHLLREYALAGGRPDWTPRPAIVAVPGGGGHVAHTDAKGRTRLYPFRTFSYRGDLPAIVAERRAIYGRWARGVAAVHAALSQPGALVAYALTGDAPPLAPWNGG